LIDKDRGEWMYYLLCSWSLSGLQHLLSFRCLFHYGFSLPGVEALAPFINPVLHVYLHVIRSLTASPSLPPALAWSWLICSWVGSHPPCQGVDFLSLVFSVSPLLLWRQANRFIAPKLPGSLGKWDKTRDIFCLLVEEIRTDQPTALCGSTFVLHFLITLLHGSCPCLWELNLKTK